MLEPSNLGRGQIAIDPRNGVLFYKDDSGSLMKTTLSWAQNTYDTISTDDEVTISKNLVIQGNLTVNGTTVSINTETVSVEDNILVLNSNVTGTPTLNSGIEVERGTSSNVSIIWDESVDKWKFTNDGSTFYDITSSNLTSLDDLLNVVVPSPVSGQVLSFDGSNWVNIDNYAEATRHIVKNDSGTTLAAGTAVYTSGANGANILVKQAQANAEVTSASTIGILAVSLLNNESGYVVTQGLVSGLNTSSAVAGDPVWLSPTVAGGLSFGLANKPSAPNHLVYLGTVTRAHANQGEIFVHILNGWELEELHNVQINSPASGDFLRYNGSVWINDPVNLATDTIGDYVQSLVAGTGVTVTNNTGEGATPTVAIDSTVATLTGSQVLTNKTIALGSNTVSGTKAQFNTAVTDDDFAYVGTANAFTANQTITGTVTTRAAATQDSVILQGRAGGTTSLGVTITPTTLTASRTLTLPDATTTVLGTDATQTVTNKTIALGSNTISGTKAQFDTAVTDDNIAYIGQANAFTTNQSVTGTITARAAATQDGIILQGRAGGTTTLGVTLTPGTLTASRTLTLPDVTGTVVTTGDTGSVSSTMILDGTIVNGDINAAAAIDKTKISGTAITAADTGTVTNTMLAGSIANTKLTNSSITIGSTSVSLGATSTTLAGLSSVTLSGSSSGTVQIIPVAAVGTGTVLTIPAITGTIITSGDSGTVSNTMLSGSIALSKLVSGTSGYIVMANGSGVPTYTNMTGKVTISSSGVTSLNASVDDLNDVVITSPAINQGLVYNGTNWVNTAIPGLTGSLVTKYATAIGDGSTKTYTITHNLATRDVTVSIISANSPYEAYLATWEATTTNTITVYFDSAPATNAVRIVVIG